VDSSPIQHSRIVEKGEFRGQREVGGVRVRNAPLGNDFSLKALGLGLRIPILAKAPLYTSAPRILDVLFFPQLLFMLKPVLPKPVFVSESVFDNCLPSL
jgi:hypothetical protein